MQIERINLREKFDRARHGFDTQLAEVLLSRSDLSHAQIGKEFGGMREPGGIFALWLRAGQHGTENLKIAEISTVRKWL